MFFIYQIIIIFIIILSPIIILIRFIKGKEDPNRFLEKFFLVKKRDQKVFSFGFIAQALGKQ